jgi:hypothetical protein
MPPFLRITGILRSRMGLSLKAVNGANGAKVVKGVHGARPSWGRSSVIAALAALLLAYCADNRVADGGSSSGVDNPSLTVGFVNDSGAALLLSGDLEVYAADQNPALDPKPLLTLKIQNSGYTKLTGSDFTRLQISSKSGSVPPLSKLSASSSAGATSATKRTGADSAATLFNLVLKTQDRTGSLVIGFKYDSVAKVFSLIDNGKSLSRFDLRPKPLVRYSAHIMREPVHGQTGRVFVPGTPFLATVVDSVFVLEDLPEGKFPLRLLSGNGNIYPMPIPLDSKDSTLIFRPGTTPLDSIDTTSQDSIPKFGVVAGSPVAAFVESAGYLDAKLDGVSPTDPRISFLWRLIKYTDDSGRVNTALPKVNILSPTSLHSEVRFEVPGVYEFELTATIGVHAQSDTLVMPVGRLTSTATPRITKPVMGETIAVYKPYNVQWEMPAKAVTIKVSCDIGLIWNTLVQGYPGKDGLPEYAWTPAPDFAANTKCQMQILNDADTTMQAKTGPFYLVE